jgi:hypothetical protein
LGRWATNPTGVGFRRHGILLNRDTIVRRRSKTGQRSTLPERSRVAVWLARAAVMAPTRVHASVNESWNSAVASRVLPISPPCPCGASASGSGARRPPSACSRCRSCLTLEPYQHRPCGSAPPSLRSRLHPSKLTLPVKKRLADESSESEARSGPEGILRPRAAAPSEQWQQPWGQVRRKKCRLLNAWRITNVASACS